MPARGSNLRVQPNYRYDETVGARQGRAPTPSRTSDAERPHLTRRRLLGAQHDTHRVGLELDLPRGDAGPHELLAVTRGQPLGRRIQELHQLHALLEVRATVAARGDADPHVVIELTANESLGHFQQ